MARAEPSSDELTPGNLIVPRAGLWSPPGPGGLHGGYSGG